MNPIDRAFQKIAEGNTLLFQGQTELAQAVSEKYDVEIDDLVDGEVCRGDLVSGLDGVLADASMVGVWVKEFLAEQEKTDG